MSNPVKKSEAKRLYILKTGSELVLHKGFVGVGLQEILKNCGIPKGSFYHYFESKEAFGCELVKHYIADYQIRLTELWHGTDAGEDAGEDAANNESTNSETTKNNSAYFKLIQYFSLWINDPLTECGWADTCLIVKLAAEVADLSEDMRLIMAQGVTDLIADITTLIDAGIQDQSIHTQSDAITTAQLIYQMWLGAALLSKLQKDKAPLHQALAATKLILNTKAPIKSLSYIHKLNT